MKSVFKNPAKPLTMLTMVLAMAFTFSCSDDSDSGGGNGNNNGTGGGWATCGTASFASAQTWTVGSQTWSDAVQCTGCGETFDGGNSDGYKADCRSVSPYKGHLFSWQAVKDYAKVLCPDGNGWRVPTKDDFINLDKALGGTGERRYNDETTSNKYLNDWGGEYGGYCESNGARRGQGANAFYWSLTGVEGSAYNIYALAFSSAGTNEPVYAGGMKSEGNAVRCVK
jgi:uncharacterized protein (TIGR02145 family)